MRTIRLNPYNYAGTHIGNKIEVSKSANFNTIELTEDSDELNHYILHLEPTEAQSYWVRISRLVRDDTTGTETYMKPSRPIEITIHSGNDINSRYVERPTIYIDNKANSVDSDNSLEPFKYNIDNYLQGNIFSIVLGDIRSDNPELSKSHLVIKNSLGKTLYHSIDENVGYEYDLDITDWVLDKHITIYASVTNIDGITSKFTPLRLYTGKKFVLNTFNVYPKLRLNFNSLIVNMGVGETLIDIVVRDNNGAVVHSYLNNSITLSLSDGLDFNTNYTMYINYEYQNESHTSEPIPITTESIVNNSIFDLTTQVLKPYNDSPVFTTRETVLDTDVRVVHLDELNGGIPNIYEDNGIPILELYGFDNFDTGNSYYNTKQVLKTAFDTRADFSTTDTVRVYALSSNRFILSLEGTYGRIIEIFSYDIFMNICVKLTTVLDTTYVNSPSVIDNNSQIVVVSEDTMVFTSYDGSSYKINVARYNPSDMTVDIQEVVIDTASNEIVLLDYDSDEIIFKTDGRYRLNINTLSIDVVGSDITLHDYSNIFRIPSSELILIASNNVYKIIDGVESLYGNLPNNNSKVIRNQDNSFFVDDGSIQHKIG